MLNTRRTIILLAAAMLAALMLSSTAAFAALRIGTDNSETIVGTNSSDLINGKGGSDTLEEKATYKVGKKKLPGGTDTLNFSKVTTSVAASLIPQWPGRNYGAAYPSIVVLDSSVVENVTGGSFEGDSLLGGGATNTLKPGGGFSNSLYDWGCNNSSAGGNIALPDLPASSDTYKGFGAAPNGAFNYVLDWGDSADKLILPGEASDYYVDAVDLDANTVNESLQVYNPTNNSSVYVAGQFGDYSNWTSLYGQHGQIEQLVFADGTFSTEGLQAQSLQAQSLEGGARTTTTTRSSVAREAEKAAQQAR